MVILISTVIIAQNIGSVSRVKLKSITAFSIKKLNVAEPRIWTLWKAYWQLNYYGVGYHDTEKDHF